MTPWLFKTNESMEESYSPGFPTGGSEGGRPAFDGVVGHRCTV